MSAYMDDLGIILDSEEALKKLEKVFDLYERAVGARLNYNKCTVLTNIPNFQPTGKWAEMPRENYQGKRTTYLGVPIALEINPKLDWEKTVRKCESVCDKIRSIHANLNEKVKMINTFAIPTLEYLARFKLMDEATAKRIWAALRRALAGKRSMKTRALFCGKRLVALETLIRHPVLQNWALLAARKPKEKGYLNPSSIGFAKLVARAIVQKKTGLDSNLIDDSKLSSSQILNTLRKDSPPGNLHEAMERTFGGGDYKIYVHNLNLLSKKLRSQGLNLLNGGWILNSQTKHMVQGKTGDCSLCGLEAETFHHLFHTCTVVEKLLKASEEAGNPVERSEKAWGLGERILSKDEARHRMCLLLCVKMALTSIPKRTELHKPWFKNTLQSLETVKKRKGQKEGRVDPTKPPSNEPKMVFYDGSGRTDNLAGGAGAALFEKGMEVTAVAQTIPYGTNNIGEFTAALIGTQAALERGWRSFAVVGDCKILTDMMKNGTSPENPVLLDIWKKIKLTKSQAESVRFYHVNRENNKRADTIAYAASCSTLAGQKAAEDQTWDAKSTCLPVSRAKAHGRPSNQIGTPMACFRYPKTSSSLRTDGIYTNASHHWRTFPKPPKNQAIGHKRQPKESTKEHGCRERSSLPKHKRSTTKRNKSKRKERKKEKR